MRRQTPHRCSASVWMCPSAPYGHPHYTACLRKKDVRVYWFTGAQQAALMNFLQRKQNGFCFPGQFFLVAFISWKHCQQFCFVLHLHHSKLETGERKGILSQAATMHGQRGPAPQPASLPAGKTALEGDRAIYLRYLPCRWISISQSLWKCRGWENEGRSVVINCCGIVRVLGWSERWELTHFRRLIYYYIILYYENYILKLY